MKKGIKLDEVEALKLWHDDDIEHYKNYCDFKITLEEKENLYVLKVSQMYEFLELNYGVFEKLSNLFGTKNIDTDKTAFAGCETCDWGSNYEIEFTIREENKI